MEYFIKYIEKWRKNFGNLKDFYLAGHSLGGYLAGHYAVRYSKYIRKLLLFSPIGIRDPPEDETWEDKMDRSNINGQQMNPLMKPILSLAWDGKISPMGVGRFFG